MSEHKIKFGTDGWRGIIAEDFTYENVRICTQGVADYLKQSRLAKKGMVIGFDTRFASENFAASAAEILVNNGIKVHLCKIPAPTPVISYSTLTTESAGAIIITASHNPSLWSGFKLKTAQGASAPNEVISEVEANIQRLINEKGKLPSISMSLSKAEEAGMLQYLDPVPQYLQKISKLVDLAAIRNNRMKIVVDSMYGAGAGYFGSLLSGANIQLTEINGERNPLFPGINPEPIAKNLNKLSSLVVQQDADIGLATDGDSDRIGIIDENGVFLNQHQVFALLSLYLLDIKKERGAIIKTVTSTEMVSRLAEIYKVDIHETAVGFKYVAPVMLQTDAIIGGEESGGYGFRNHIPERDAIVAGLYFLDFMIKTGKKPSQLLDMLYSKVGPHYYNRIDLPISQDEKPRIIERLAKLRIGILANRRIIRTSQTDGFQFFLDDGSWLLIRFSGTEPLVRIYSEGDSPENVDAILAEGKNLL
jgi:alpha-D-glucose phosphate-specific phosphoglucomutase